MLVKDVCFQKIGRNESDAIFKYIFRWNTTQKIKDVVTDSKLVKKLKDIIKRRR